MGCADSLNNFQVDGRTTILCNVEPGLFESGHPAKSDAVSEFKVQTTISVPSTAAAAVRSQCIVKSGSNDFHGAVWDYLRNTN